MKFVLNYFAIDYTARVDYDYGTPFTQLHFWIKQGKQLYLEFFFSGIRLFQLCICRRFFRSNFSSPHNVNKLFMKFVYIARTWEIRSEEPLAAFICQFSYHKELNKPFHKTLDKTFIVITVLSSVLLSALW